MVEAATLLFTTMIYAGAVTALTAVISTFWFAYAQGAKVGLKLYRESKFMRTVVCEQIEERIRGHVGKAKKFGRFALAGAATAAGAAVALSGNAEPLLWAWLGAITASTVTGFVACMSGVFGSMDANHANDLARGKEQHAKVAGFEQKAEQDFTFGNRFLKLCLASVGVAIVAFGLWAGAKLVQQKNAPIKIEERVNCAQVVRRDTEKIAFINSDKSWVNVRVARDRREQKSFAPAGGQTSARLPQGRTA
ncbi:Uncharacterised protein [Candidatus Gugararchaeum adminiculabundum]|nr:Uncharacterised protein [Candidatus Gugararchaeum adminiculabundum]